jgi:hypothetical protein
MFAALALLSPGCKQDEGERCQTDSDCGDGLTCCTPIPLEGTCCRGDEDAGTPSGEPGPDVAIDAPAPPDASADVPPTDVMFEPSGE